MPRVEEPARRPMEHPEVEDDEDVRLLGAVEKRTASLRGDRLEPDRVEEDQCGRSGHLRDDRVLVPREVP